MKERFSIARSCCGPVLECYQCSDQFTRADDTDISVGAPCPWVEVVASGIVDDFEIVSNKLFHDSSSRSQAYIEFTPVDTQLWATRATVELPNAWPARAEIWNHTALAGYSPGNNRLIARVFWDPVGGDPTKRLWTLQYYEFLSQGEPTNSPTASRTIQADSSIESALLCMSLDGDSLRVSMQPVGGELVSVVRSLNPAIFWATTQEAGVEAINTARFTDFRVEDITSGTITGSHCYPCEARIECGGCDSGTDLLPAYNVDLGAAVHTNEQCDNCNSIAGIVQVQSASDDGDECFWDFVERTCDPTIECDPFHLAPDCGDFRNGLNVTMTLVLDDPVTPTTAQLKVVVSFSPSVSVGAGCGVDAACLDSRPHYAEYESSVFSVPGLDCNTLFPITLNKVLEDTSGDLCSGTFNSTIEVTA